MKLKVTTICGLWVNREVVSNLSQFEGVDWEFLCLIF